MWFEVARRMFRPDATPQDLGAYILARRTIDRWLPGLWPWCSSCSSWPGDDIPESAALEAVAAYFDGNKQAATMASIGLAYVRGDQDTVKSQCAKLDDRDRVWVESIPAFDDTSLALHHIIEGIQQFETKLMCVYNIQFGGPPTGFDTAASLSTGILVGWHTAILDIWLSEVDTMRNVFARVRMVLELYAPGLCVAFDCGRTIGARRVGPLIEIDTPVSRAQCYRAYMGFGERAEVTAQGFLFGSLLAQERLDTFQHATNKYLDKFQQISETKAIMEVALESTAAMRALDAIHPEMILHTSFALHSAFLRTMRTVQ